MFGQPPWTDEENLALIRLVNEGRTSGEISRLLNKTRSAVVGRVHRMDLRLSGGSNRNGTGSGYRYWTSERLKDLEKLYLSALGYSRQEIARELNIDERLLATGIRHLRKLHNLKSPPRKPKALQPAIKRHAPRQPDNMTDLPTEQRAHARPFISLVQGMCKWPVSGAGVSMMCCASEAIPFGPYCVSHAKRAHRWD